MKISKVFRLAKKSLMTGMHDLYQVENGVTLRKFPYICWTLEELEGVRPRDWRRNRKIIMDLIAPYNTVTGWLNKQNPRLRKRINEQDYRHAWLDKLISEYEAKGQ